jgi:hypothetical protein
MSIHNLEAMKIEVTKIEVTKIEVLKIEETKIEVMILGQWYQSNDTEVS